MPTIKLSDRTGLDVGIELAEDASIAKYFKNLANLNSLKLPTLEFSDLENVPLDRVDVKNVHAGLSFEQPVEIGVDRTEMKISTGIKGGVTLLTPRDEQVFDPEHFGDAIKINPNERYLSVGVEAQLAGGVSGKIADLGFGFDAGSSITLRTYKPFKGNDQNGFPGYVRALDEALKAFVVMGDIEDLRSMEDGVIAVAEGSGSLKFTVTANLLSVVNPLASIESPVDLPGDFGELKISSGNKITVGASVEFTGTYQLRVQRFAGGKVRLGFYKKRGTDSTFKVSAVSGISGGVGKFDLFERVLKAISSNPEADIEELKRGGLGDAQIAVIEKTLEAGIARKLELALNLELSSGSTTEAAFLYDVDLDRLDADGRRAIHHALDGDLTDLVKDDETLPQGVALVRSIFTEAQKRRHTFKFNLLGIYNYISISTLILKGMVMYEPETGEIVITDKATASRIAASTFNFAADSTKLRKLLAESFLITAAYRCSRLAAGAPELKISHSYFELHSKTDRGAMKNNLDVAEALGLLPQRDKEILLGDANNFGRTTFYAETSYTDDLAAKLFLKDDQPRPAEDYEQAGRAALRLLVQQGERDDFRRLPTTNDALWQEMKRQGQPSFRFIPALDNFNKTQLEVIATDYTVIMWWAKEMREMSVRLHAVRKFLADNPHIDPENNIFKMHRRKLAQELKDIAKRTKREFGDPWGLVAMDLASGKQAEVKLLFTGTRLSLALARAAI